jgi:hypothetical protein
MSPTLPRFEQAGIYIVWYRYIVYHNQRILLKDFPTNLLPLLKFKIFKSIILFALSVYPGSRGSLRGERNKMREQRASGHIRAISPGSSKAYMLKKVPNIQRIINDILKIVNIVFFRGGFAPCRPLPSAVYGPGSHRLQIPLPHLITLRI